MKTSIALLLAVTGLFLAGCSTTHQSTIWDYKVVTEYVPSALEQSLKQLGKEGWVVVSSTASPNPPNPAQLIVILKRPKQ
jgi:hypothetical protein